MQACSGRRGTAFGRGEPQNHVSQLLCGNTRGCYSASGLAIGPPNVRSRRRNEVYHTYGGHDTLSLALFIDCNLCTDRAAWPARQSPQTSSSCGETEPPGCVESHESLIMICSPLTLDDSGWRYAFGPVALVEMRSSFVMGEARIAPSETRGKSPIPWFKV